MKIPLSSPDIDEQDIEAVVGVLRTPQLSLGPQLTAFETRFAEYIGVQHGIALSSGTAGLQLSLQALGVGPGDEVVLPSFTFIAVANAVRHTGARPVFADIDRSTLNLTANSVGRVLTNKTRAIIAVHTFGIPADLHPLLSLAREHALPVIEDACEAIGAEYRGRKAGSFGELAVFSFYPNKPLTTGEGGLVVTGNETLARTLRALRNQGRMEGDDWLEHSIAGYNCRLPEMSCALGLSQLSRSESILAKRESVANFYREALAGCPLIILPPFSIEGCRISWFAFVVRLAPELPPSARGDVMRALTAADIGCRAYFPPIHLQPLFAEHARPEHPLPVTEEVAATTLALPFFNTLSREQVEQVCRVLQRALEDAARRKT